jgi:hypothetical protein
MSHEEREKSLPVRGCYAWLVERFKRTRPCQFGASSSLRTLSLEVQTQGAGASAGFLRLVPSYATSSLPSSCRE